MSNEHSRSLTHDELVTAVDSRARAWEAARSAAQVIATKSEYIREARSCSEGFDSGVLRDEFFSLLSALDLALALAIKASDKAGG